MIYIPSEKSLQVEVLQKKGMIITSTASKKIMGKRKKSLPLSEPCKIIDEYLEDERFKHFKAFDGPAHIKRSVSINEHIISSVGIGI